MSSLALKMNIDEQRRGIVHRVPFALRAKALTPSARAIGGAVWAFTDPKKAEKGYKATYSQMQMEMGLCRQTVSENVELLKDRALISSEKLAEGGTKYVFVGELKGKSYVTVPLYLYTVEVKTGERFRRLTKAEVLLLAYIMQQGEILNKRECRASVREFSVRLGLGRTTVRNALRFFLRTGLLSCPRSDKGNSRVKASVYHVAQELYCYKKYTRLAKLSEKEREKALEEERKAYYAQMQEENKRKAERYASWVLSIPEWTEVNRQLKTLELAYAKAELGRGTQTVAQLAAQKGELTLKRQGLMRKFAIDERKYEARTYARCKACEDTGQRKDGKQCDCWVLAVGLGELDKK